MFSLAGDSLYGVIHFAAHKAVGESLSQPLRYYDNNVGGTLSLLKVMEKHNCKRIGMCWSRSFGCFGCGASDPCCDFLPLAVFSSSATVYGTEPAPYTEETPTGHGITNPYGKTKHLIEIILSDMGNLLAAPADQPVDAGWEVCILRYFNPVGAHSSGLIGEDPSGIPNNLMPYVQQVAVGRREKLTIFGSDYETKDGSAERDYIHVEDLASGHVCALQWMETGACRGCEVFNLGTGVAKSVLEVIAAFSKAAGKDLPYVMGERRAGDIAVSYAIADKAERVLGWKSKHSLDEMCTDAWRWQSMNPKGFASPIPAQEN